MLTPFLRFLTRLSVFSIILGLFTLLIFMFVPIRYASPTLPYQFVFFYTVTLFVHYVLLRASQKNQGRFVARFMLTSFLKLIFYIAVLIVYLILNKNDTLRFVIPYFMLYVCYTTFEVVSISHIIRK